MIRIFVEGVEVDVKQTTSVLLTLAIDDIRIKGSKESTFSKSFILEGTNRNNALFGSIFEVTVANDFDPTKPNRGTNFNAAIGASCYVFQDSIQQFKGTMRMIEVVVDGEFISYEVYFIGEYASFSANRGNKKLEDLDFSSYNHTLSIANINASKANLGTGAGYIYPLIDYGFSYDGNKKDWRIQTFRPAFHVKEYIDKIFADSPYTYDASFFNTAMFKRLYIPHNQKQLVRQSANVFDVSRVPMTDFGIFQADGIEYREPFDTITTIGSFTASDSNKLFTYSGSSFTSTITVTGSLQYKNELNPVDAFYLRLYKGATQIGTLAAITEQDQSTVNINFSAIVTINNTDSISVTAQAQSGAPLTEIEIKITELNIRIAGSVGQLVPVGLGEEVKANDTIPKNFLQIDFLSWVTKLFNLLVYEDPTKEKVLKIAPWIDFFADASTVDWTNKLDRAKPYKIKPMSLLNARYYQFNYKDDSDYFNDLYKKRYNKSYGSYIYDSLYEFSKETEKVEVGFSATPLVGYVGEAKVYSTIVKRNNNVDEATDSNIRILQAKLITGVPSWNIYAAKETTVLDTSTEYVYAGHFDSPDNPTFDLNYGVLEELFFTLLTGAINVNLFNVYWSAYMAEIVNKDSRMLIGQFKLTHRDIENFNFGQYVHLMGADWRVNKIIDFNATKEETCTVELIRVINKIY